ncbi:hypothetical protein CSKR_103819 [Clonorchis sinensis]|uniref:CUB domain-containing protein n=1 Tax=Clonorchis sinensis TaxID=79923 RepID=A0A8T1MB80_CLOSI|nr:hypothetical protein CSKR_103819 [Clonorchis sinensis]
MVQWLEREFTDRKVRGLNPTSVSPLPLSGLGQPGIIPALVLPSGVMATRHRKVGERMVEPALLCENNNPNGSGLITAPEVDIPYRCIWYIHAIMSGRVSVTVQVASTYPSSDKPCPGNYVALFDGPSLNSTLVANFTNEPLYSYLSRQSVMTVLIVRLNMDCEFYAMVLYSTVLHLELDITEETSSVPSESNEIVVPSAAPSLNGPVVNNTINTDLEPNAAEKDVTYTL